MQPMRGCEQIEKRVVRIARHVNPLTNKLSPREKLRNDKAGSEQDRINQPTRIRGVVISLQRPSRYFYRDAADENQRGAQPQHLWHRNRLPVIRRRRAHNVRAGQRHEKHQDAGDRYPNADAVSRRRKMQIIAAVSTVPAAVLVKAVAAARTAAAKTRIDYLI